MIDASPSSPPAPARPFRSWAQRAGRSALAWLAACAAAGTVHARDAVRLDVPYVPTPQHVVERMFEVAELQPREYVVDLGCGDGRMVVTAASRFGARALGVDINPARIDEAKDNAARAGVSDRVELKVGDLFEADIGDADVLAVYLLDSINLRLRPKILETMRPGARVVSHAFDMGEWRPDRIEKIDGRTIYLWYVPAKVAGRWQISQGDRRIEIDLRQRFQDLSGTATIDGRSVPLREGRVRGDEVVFRMETAPGETRTFRGRVDGNRMIALGTGVAPWRGTRRTL